jgi:hypothetical protein
MHLKNVSVPNVIAINENNNSLYKMHESNEQFVKSYIDNKTFENNFFKIEGWTFHEKLGILPLRIKTNDNHFDIKIKNRQDVASFYNNSNILNCGWYIDNIPNKYSKVDSCGKYRNNIGYEAPREHKDYMKFLNNYRFSICFENKNQLNYVTEKLFYS